MNKKFSLSSLLAIVLLFSTLTFVLTSAFYMKESEQLLGGYVFRNELARKLTDLINTYNDQYIGTLDEEKLIDGALMGYVYGTEDRYGEYMNKENYAKLTLENEGKSVGIGISVIESDKMIKIVDIIPNSPAAKSDLRIGDLIDSVETRPVEDLGYTAAVNSMIGKEGTEAVFTVLRDGQKLDFRVAREVIESSSVDFKMLDSKVAYIRISQFIGTTYGEFSGIMEKLKKDGVRNVIFDVRNNPGGDLAAICSVLDDLLPEGPIIQIVGKNNVVEDTIHSDKDAYDLNSVVLVNGNTCSAAELFSAAIRDYKKGVLIGTKTFGKGCMQTIIPFKDGTAVRVTTNYYNPPSGVNYDGIGITPDMVVEAPAGVSYYELTDKNDLQLQAALAHFKK